MKRVIQADRSSGKLFIPVPEDSTFKEGDFVELSKAKLRRVSYIGVVGDLFHYGHLQSIKFAKSQGDFLICGVFTDEAVEEYRRKPVANYDERRAIVESLSCVDRVIKQDSRYPLENLKTIHQEFPDAEIILVHGDNWRNVPGSDFVKSIGGKVVQHPFYERLSNFKIINYLVEGKDKFKDILDFTNFIGKDLNYDEEKGDKSIIFSLANTLNAIKPLLKKSFIPPFETFTIEEWKKDPKIILNKIKAKFEGQEVIVKSSPIKENFFEVGAEIKMNFNAADSSDSFQVEKIVDKMISVYQSTIGLNPIHQILIQNKINNLSLKGNIFRKEESLYILNYDEIINGETVNNSTVKIDLSNELQGLSSNVRRIIESVQEIESTIQNVNLDIDFLISNHNLFILKVEPLSKQFIHGWSETTSLQSMEAHTIRYVRFPENIGNSINGSIFLEVRNKHHTCYFDKKDVVRWNHEGKVLMQEAARNGIIRKNLEQIKRFKEFYENHKTDDYQIKTNLELARIYRDLLYLVMENGSFFPYSRQEITFPVKEKIISLLPEGKNKDNIFQLLTTPAKEDLFSREEKDRLNTFRKENCSKEDLYQYALRNSYRFINTYSKKLVLDYLMAEKEDINIPELESAINKKKQENLLLKQKQEQLFQEINSPLLLDLCEFMQNIAVIRLENKSVWSGFEFQFLDLFQEISNRLGLSVDDFLFSYRIEEILRFLEEGVLLPYDIVRKRLTYFNLEIRNETTEVEYKPRYNKEIDPLPKDKEIVSGEPGNLGRVIGRALIVTDDSIHSLMKLKKEMTPDDIYITGMTHPAMVSLLHKAKGIITDEGGATCHAAIISRELNLPCLVGTKIATRFFKTGEFIEIDANNKFCRKLTEKEIEEYRAQGRLQPVIKGHDNKQINIPQRPINKIPYLSMFSEVDNEGLSIIGGKGRNLVACFSNHTVPNGFCITKRLYEEVINKFLNDRKELIINLDDCSEILSEIRKFIVSYELSDEFKTELKNKLFTLSSDRFAVRSSASCEDSSKLSFAGQFKTVLGIKEDKVISAIKECLASAFLENVLVYSFQCNIDYSKFFMAVVVQEFLPSEKAGVLFSKNPAYPQREGFWIDANFGVGESVVSGEVKPDRYFVNGSESEVFISEDKEAYSYIEDGKLSVEKRTGRVLNDEEIKQLVNLGENLRRSYDREIECEWAFYNNKLHLLQVRPITTIDEE